MTRTYLKSLGKALLVGFIAYCFAQFGEYAIIFVLARRAIAAHGEDADLGVIHVPSVAPHIGLVTFGYVFWRALRRHHSEARPAIHD